MNPNIKTRWVERLRSGEYKQGQGYLHVGDKFCCLGVLCDMAVEEGIVTQGASASEKTFSYGRHGEVATLPLEVTEWASLAVNPIIPEIDFKDGEEKVYTLAAANDKGMSFNDIADLIEEHL